MAQMTEDPRDRVLFPFATPILLLAIMGGLVFLFSRILLNVPPGVAVAVALLTGINIIFTCAVVSMRRLHGLAVALLVLAFFVPAIVGGAAASNAIKIHVKAKPPAKAPPIVVTAANLAFSTTTIHLVAGSDTITFKNEDTQPHNIDIFNGPSASSPSLFRGAVAGPGAQETYNISNLQPGTYFFHCDIHPTLMTGTVVVSAAGSGSGYGSGASSNSLTVTAQNIKFSTASITLSANTPATITFKNQDTQPHNIDIFNGPTATSPSLFKGAVALPGATETYSIPALKPGTYFFHCDIHPTQMTGTVTVH